MNAKRVSILISVVVLLALLTSCSLNATTAPGSVVTTTPNYMATTVFLQTQMAAVLATPTVTEAPTETEAPTPEPTVVVCDTPSIKVSLDGLTWSEMGQYLKTELGERMTYTSRSFLVPEKEWNVKLTAEELKTVETTWQFVQICVPDTTFARVFAGGYEQKLIHHDDGVIMTLEAGSYEFKIRNGEIVLWYPENSDFAMKDLTRIIEQIKSGNFDINGELALFGVTTDLLPQIPQDLVKDKDIQIIPDAVVISQ